ncbi:helix-turn-helix domain-containing protein [Tardiphaga sp. 839_C3_N1_4]|uniref:helix-turn-helix domain-containing protein n=1 Tax=Tardiphaga sp. 839_C3_N1_4 TaxID=3240761 RepID=UPI003F20C52E
MAGTRIPDGASYAGPIHMLEPLPVSLKPKSKIDVFGCPASKLHQDQELRGAGIKFFRKGSEDPHLGQVVTAADDRGFLIGISQGRGHRRRVFHEHHATGQEFEEGSIYIRNLADDYRADLRGAFDFLLMEVSRPFLIELAQEHGWRGAVDLACHAGDTDPVLLRLVSVVEPFLQKSSEASPLFLDQLGTTIGIHLIERYNNATSLEATSQGAALSRPQLALAIEMLSSNAAGNVRVADVAQACGLSRGYFIRGFKKATGKAPHQWILSQRVEQARGLLMKTDTPLADVALACGFADQSHFTRVFSAATGLPPGAWRRASGNAGSPAIF